MMKLRLLSLLLLVGVTVGGAFSAFAESGFVKNSKGQDALAKNRIIGKPPEMTAAQKEAAKVTAVYAQHIYTTICAEEYRAGLPIHKLKKYQDQQVAYAHAQAACGCMAEELLKKLPPDSLVDYVMYNYGASPDDNENPDKIDAETRRYYMSEKASIADEAISDPKIRKKCGFLN